VQCAVCRVQGACACLLTLLTVTSTALRPRCTPQAAKQEDQAHRDIKGTDDGAQQTTVVMGSKAPALLQAMEHEVKPHQGSLDSVLTLRHAQRVQQQLKAALAGLQARPPPPGAGAGEEHVEGGLAAQRYLQRPAESQLLWRVLLAKGPAGSYRAGQELRTCSDELTTSGEASCCAS
jgi:hypothetical protein